MIQLFSQFYRRITDTVTHEWTRLVVLLQRLMFDSQHSIDGPLERAPDVVEWNLLV